MLKFYIDDSYLPYFVDILNYNAIVVDELKEHIDKFGRDIYQKGQI